MPKIFGNHGSAVEDQHKYATAVADRRDVGRPAAFEPPQINGQITKI
jgi:hypothetical protein